MKRLLKYHALVMLLGVLHIVCGILEVVTLGTIHCKMQDLDIIILKEFE